MRDELVRGDRPSNRGSGGEMSLAWIRRNYGVPAFRGTRITFQGRRGVITCGKGKYLRVWLDGEKKAVSLHPTWEVEYAKVEGK